MKYGVNLLLFGDQVNDAVLSQFAAISALGFDGLEVPVFTPEMVPVDAIRSAADSAGLALTVSGALPPGSRFYGKDRGAREKATRYMEEALDVAARLGSRIFCGPLYKPVGDSDESVSLDEQRAETAAALQPLCRTAEEHGVRLAFEPLNRFETNLLNTVDQGVDFCEAIGHPAAGLLLDTFHMHIEEKDTAAALKRAQRAGRLVHFHASENDRGIAGSGQARWDEVAAALAGTYDDWVVLESFDQNNQAIRTAVSCWRPFYEDAEVFMRDGLKHVKRLFG